MSAFSRRGDPDASSLPSEGHLPGFDGATGWLNSEALTAADLRGHVALIDFWTFSCINWIRTAPYVQAWYERYREQGLIVVGVHSPEFPFERDVDDIRAAIDERHLTYPVAVDSDYAVWTSFANHYWPAIYLADASGVIRFHHFGEGLYDETERTIQALVGGEAVGSDLVVVDTSGVDRPADWESLQSPETYVGFEQAERFASPGSRAWDERRTYEMPPSLGLNSWALSGEWTIGAKAARLDEAGGELAYRFRARDLNLVMGPAQGGASVDFRVSIDGAAPDDAHGIDIDERGEGTASTRRLHQLVRQPAEVEEHTFEITFLDPGVEAYVFTFG